jgi:hypothetical protein
MAHTQTLATPANRWLTFAITYRPSEAIYGCIKSKPWIGGLHRFNLGAQAPTFNLSQPELRGMSEISLIATQCTQRPKDAQ